MSGPIVNNDPQDVPLHSANKSGICGNPGLFPVVAILYESAPCAGHSRRLSTGTKTRIAAGVKRFVDAKSV